MVNCSISNHDIIDCGHLWLMVYCISLLKSWMILKAALAPLWKSEAAKRANRMEGGECERGEKANDTIECGRS